MLEQFARYLSNSIFGITPHTLMDEAVSFFIADIIKIFFLLAVIIFVVSILRSFIPPEKIRKILAGRHPLVGHILAAVFGIFTPFCSCSAIPLFLGFIEAGVPVGVTFSFLVSAPMVNEVALVLLLGMFGWQVAGLYIVSGLVIAIVSGLFIGRMKPEELITTGDYKKKIFENNLGHTWSERAHYAYGYTANIIRRVWPYIIVGVGLGAWIHGYVPADFLAQYAGADKWYAVPLAVLIGIPLYSNAAGVIPLVGVLMEKGVAMGTVLAFMMAVTALSLPEFMILKRVMKTKLIIIFASVVGLGIIFTGYLFNGVLR